MSYIIHIWEFYNQTIQRKKGKINTEKAYCYVFLRVTSNLIKHHCIAVHQITTFSLFLFFIFKVQYVFA